MRQIVVSLLVIGLCQLSALTDADAQRPPPILKAFFDPVLEPSGVTADQAALDHACERRSVLPAAKPFPETVAIARTGRAKLEGKKIKVGKHSFPAAAADPERLGYSYVGRYAAREVDILLFNDFDSVGWTIVESGAGPLDVPQLLIPSPNGKVWATAGDWDEPDGSITLYSLEPTRWTKLAEIPVAFACDLHWSDETTLSFRTSKGFYKPLSSERQITFAAGAWVLKP